MLGGWIELQFVRAGQRDYCLCAPTVRLVRTATVNWAPWGLSVDGGGSRGAVHQPDLAGLRRDRQTTAERFGR
jgi:hypothetical protein